MSILGRHHPGCILTWARKAWSLGRDVHGEKREGEGQAVEKEDTAPRQAAGRHHFPRGGSVGVQP